SVSPAIHGAAYELLGRQARYTLHDAPDEGALRAALSRIASGEFAGANVTVPWKRAALEACERVDASAAGVGAANVVARAADGALVAYNTDALALAEELRLGCQGLGRPERGALVVLGTGGAARAAVVSARLAGFERIFVSGRSFEPSRAESEWPGVEEWQALGARPLAWPPQLPEGVEAIVQATSAGMKGAPGGEELAALVPWAALPPLLAYDLVYNPPLTPFLRIAAEHGHSSRGGLGMLVGQAARAIEIWWGVLPPLEPLEAAARKALGLD
ncbi:MAG TPA: shikimate dehydrogenase, partial [Polyangiaceae bacterium]|nr:shikimate dehydrogenase [Polyangiaceae bacterium]